MRQNETKRHPRRSRTKLKSSSYHNWIFVTYHFSHSLRSGFSTANCLRTLWFTAIDDFFAVSCRLNWILYIRNNAAAITKSMQMLSFDDLFEYIKKRAYFWINLEREKKSIEVFVSRSPDSIRIWILFFKNCCCFCTNSIYAVHVSVREEQERKKNECENYIECYNCEKGGKRERERENKKETIAALNAKFRKKKTKRKLKERSKAKAKTKSTSTCVRIRFEHLSQRLKKIVQ